MPKRTTPYRARLLQSLINPDEAVHCLNAAINDSPEMFLKALRNVAQAHQMAKVAKKAGVARENLYRAFSEGGNPTLDTLHSVLAAVGLDIHVATKESVARGSTPALRPKELQASESQFAEVILGRFGTGKTGTLLTAICEVNVQVPDIKLASWQDSASGITGMARLLNQAEPEAAGLSAFSFVPLNCLIAAEREIKSDLTKYGSHKK